MPNLLSSPTSLGAWLGARCVAKVVTVAIIATATFLPTAEGEPPALHRLAQGRLDGAPADETIMLLDGVPYAKLDALTTAVAKLSPGSRLVWASGCTAFEEIPLGGTPRMTIPAFKTFCSKHKIRFDYLCGMSISLKTKTFTAPRTFFKSSASNSQTIDVRESLKMVGVSFPGGPGLTYARWQPAKQRLTVRNTLENLDLIEVLIDDAQSK